VKLEPKQEGLTSRLFWHMPDRGPRVLREKKSVVREVFYRGMYLVFLGYAGIVISAGILSSFFLLGQLFAGGFVDWSWISAVCAIGLLWLLGMVRDFWVKHFDLYRMDDTFSGASYLDKHLDHPKWPEVDRMMILLSQDQLGVLEREEIRREICRIARLYPSLYEAVYELGDDRLKWSLVNFRAG
jgi:hypothetical protein